MTQTERHSTLLNELMAQCRADPRLQAEVLRAEREFFAANPKAPATDPGAPQRFAEWFLLERESDSLGEVPMTRLQLSEADRELLSDSLAGVFLVLGPSGQEVLIRDLQDDADLEIEAPPGVVLQADDMLIGRLYAGSLDTYLPSMALAAQRQAGALAAALRKDLRGMEIDRRLTQAEIEHLLFRGSADAAEALEPEQPLERLEADLEAALQKGGVDPEKVSATAISAALEAAPRPGPVVNPLLEQLAFDTKVDLQQVQELLLRIWNQHQARQQTRAETEPDAEAPARPAAPAADEDLSPGLGAEVHRRLEEGLAQGGKVEEVFYEVERMLGGDAPEEPDAGALAAAGEGDLRPLLQEFLWEVDEPAKDQVLRGHLERLLRTQLEAPVPVLDLERLQPADLLRMLLEVYLQARPGSRAAAVGDCFAAVEHFFTWAVETQQYELDPVLRTVREALVEPSVRLDLASVALGATALDGDGPPRLLRVVALSEGLMQLATLDEDQLHEVEIPEHAQVQLRSEDLVLAGLQPSGTRSRLCGLVVVLPALARDFLGS